MKIDHLVLTTESVDAMLAFYTGFLGMRHEEKGGGDTHSFPGI